MNVLILVDIQNDFLPGGALAVAEGDRIIPLVNTLSTKFSRIVATQDWHPADHGSFASSHPGKSPGEKMDLNGLEQVLWPVHCVQQSKGAEFSDQLKVSVIEKVFVKGTDKNIDSYSGFYDNGHRKSTGLAEYLRVDPDHFPVQIEQRSARVARIDGDVGLNERHVVFVGQAAALGADDPGRG